MTSLIFFCYAGLPLGYLFAARHLRQHCPAYRSARNLTSTLILLHFLLFVGTVLTESTRIAHGSSVVCLVTWSTMLLLWLESFWIRLPTLFPAIAFLGSINALVTAFSLTQEAAITPSLAAFLSMHSTSALIAYGLLLLTLVNIFLLLMAEQHLKRLRSPSYLEQSSALLTIEKMVFRITVVTFIAVSITLLSGIFSIEKVSSQHHPHDTPTIYFAWGILCWLIIGHFRYGWRGIQALVCIGSGFLGLLLIF